jgi:hypothetical protein
VIALTIVVSVDATATASVRKIRWIAVNDFVSHEALRSEEVDRIGFDIGG